MTTEYDEAAIGALEEMVREAIEDLPEVHANPGFRARLRREFATGRFGPPRPAPVLPAPWWVTALKWSPLPAAVAAVFVFAMLNRGPDWEVVAAAGTGNLVVDGEVVPLTDAAAVADGIRRGGRLAWTPAERTAGPEGQITLRSPGVLLVQAAADAEAVIPSPPGRWIQRGLRARVDRGEVLFQTGERFPGRTLRVETPVGVTEVTGTLFSVVTDSVFSCVCVLEGTAWVGRSEERMEAIPAGMRRVMFADTRPSVTLPIEPLHAADLARFQAQQGFLLHP